MMQFVVQMPLFWEIFGGASDAVEPGQVDPQGPGQNRDPPAMSSALHFTQDGAEHTRSPAAPLLTWWPCEHH